MTPTFQLARPRAATHAAVPQRLSRHQSGFDETPRHSVCLHGSISRGATTFDDFADTTHVTTYLEHLIRQLFVFFLVGSLTVSKQKTAASFHGTFP
jgi:hypothetical protein